MIALLIGLLLGPVRPVHQLQFHYSAVFDASRQCQCVGYPTPPSSERVIEERARYENLWDSLGDKLRGQMKRATGLDLPLRDTVVFIVGCGDDLSDPVTLWTLWPSGETRSDRAFMKAIRHELLHQALTQEPFKSKQERLLTKYGDSVSDVAINHIQLVAWEANTDSLEFTQARYAGQPLYLKALELAIAEGLVEDSKTNGVTH